MRRVLFAAAIVLLLVACGLGTYFWSRVPPVAPSPPSTIAPGDPQARKVVVQGSNAFAFDLYERLSGDSGNLIYSPYSISAALAMTRLGAQGETADQMTKVLQLPTEPSQVSEGYANLLHELNGVGKPRQFQLLTANAIWPQKGLPFRPAYTATLQSHFGASAQELDYKSDPEQARLTINAWVAEQTKQKIPELLDKGIIKKDARLVLTNAVYFKAGWAEAFDKDLTSQGDFHLDATRKIQLPIMFQALKLTYHEGNGFQAIELPYKDQDVSMMIVLPRKLDGLSALEKVLPKELLTKGLRKSVPKEVRVRLPRFKLNFKLDLREKLMGMGMPLPFRKEMPLPDFSGMTEYQPVGIGHVIHEAVIEVDEEGTVASAATGVVMETVKSTAPSEPSLVFNADHPFLFVIRDQRTGCILFMGRVTNPQV
jgi:serpin B